MDNFMKWVNDHKAIVIGGTVIGAVVIFLVVKKFGGSTSSQPTSATASYQPVGSYAGNYGSGSFDSGAIYGQLENSIISAQNQNSLYGTSLTNSLNSLQQTWASLMDEVSNMGKTTYTSNPPPTTISTSPTPTSPAPTSSIPSYLTQAYTSTGQPANIYSFNGEAIPAGAPTAPSQVAPGSVFYSGPANGFTVG